MGDIKLRRISDGEEVIKSEVNWKNLDKKAKEKYEVLDGSETATTKVTFTPPEVGKKLTANADNKQTATGKPEGGKGEKAEVAETPEQTAQRLKIVELSAGGKTNGEIAKELGTHHSNIRSILAKHAKLTANADNK